MGNRRSKGQHAGGTSGSGNGSQTASTFTKGLNNPQLNTSAFNQMPTGANAQAGATGGGGFLGSVLGTVLGSMQDQEQASQITPQTLAKFQQDNPIPRDTWWDKFTGNSPAAAMQNAIQQYIENIRPFINAQLTNQTIGYQNSLNQAADAARRQAEEESKIAAERRMRSAAENELDNKAVAVSQLLNIPLDKAKAWVRSGEIAVGQNQANKLGYNAVPFSLGAAPNMQNLGAAQSLADIKSAELAPQIQQQQLTNLQDQSALEKAKFEEDKLNNAARIAAAKIHSLPAGSSLVDLGGNKTYSQSLNEFGMPSGNVESKPLTEDVFVPNKQQALPQVPARVQQQQFSSPLNQQVSIQRSPAQPYVNPVESAYTPSESNRGNFSPQSIQQTIQEFLRRKKENSFMSPLNR